MVVLVGSQVSIPPRAPIHTCGRKAMAEINKQKLLFGGCCEIYRGSPYLLLSSCFHLPHLPLARKKYYIVLAEAINREVMV